MGYHRSRGSYEGNEGHEGGKGEKGIHHRSRRSYEGNEGHEGCQGEEGIGDRNRGGYEGNEGHESGEGVAFSYMYMLAGGLSQAASDCRSGRCTIFALACRAPATGPCIGEAANSAAPELAGIEVVTFLFLILFVLSCSCLLLA